MSTGQQGGGRWRAILIIGFGLTMVAIGVADLTRPPSFRAAMDSLQMPHYLLWILGGAKIAGGLSLAAIARLRERAFTGFFIWAAGGLSAHVLSGHGLSATAPLVGLSIALISAYAAHRTGPRAMERG